MNDVAGEKERAADGRTPRNLVLCLDGTSNQFNPDGNTNVVRLIQSLTSDPAQQLSYYDPGVGTMPTPGIIGKIGQTLDRYLSLAFGNGLIRNVEEAYIFLMNYWEPGDRVFLFGFSRGAYSARVLAGLLHMLGLFPRGNENLVPYLTRLYSGTRQGKAGQVYWKLCNQFRKTFARPIEGELHKAFPVHFLGVWDTVSSVGWVWNPKSFPHSADNPSIRTVCHAVAIDERRSFFRQNLFAKGVVGQVLHEHWFPGSHGDVGGGYRENQGGLWKCSFLWMLDHAKNAGLLIDAARYEHVLKHHSSTPNPWAEELHDSLTWAWWPAEFIPKFRHTKGRASFLPSCGLGRSRIVPPEAEINEASLRRIRDDGAMYRPKNLSAAFIDKVKQLKQVPSAFAYESA